MGLLIKNIKYMINTILQTFKSENNRKIESQLDFLSAKIQQIIDIDIK